MDGNGNCRIRLVIRIDNEAIKQCFPGTPLRNYLKGIAIPNIQGPPDAERSRDDPAPPTARKEPNRIYSTAFARGGHDAMKRRRRGSPVETKFVGAQCLSFEILGRERCQSTAWEWDTISENFIRAGGLPNGMFLRYEIKSSRYLSSGKMRDLKKPMRYIHSHLSKEEDLRDGECSKDVDEDVVIQ